MKKIHITVTGVCGSGKTTIAREFELFLKGKGFTNVSVKDPDREFGCDHPELQEQRIKNLGEQVEVTIETVQIRKE